MTVIGAGIGILFGLGAATLFSATGFTDFEAPATAAASDATPSVSTYSPPPVDEDDTDEAVLRGPGSKVSPGQHFALSGTIPSVAAGTTLQVQVKEPNQAWADFPVTVTTREGGIFETELKTTRTGERQFRLLDKVSNSKTPPFTVTIG